MKRRDFLHIGIITSAAGALGAGRYYLKPGNSGSNLKSLAKNIIFMVSDGMSTGTLTMANQLAMRKENRYSHWLQLYHENKVSRALMDTSSANSLVTDSAAASSAWGGGYRVNNGSLNIGPDGTNHKPILQKFKAAGKSVGCVTTVPITHATPAGFCVNSKSRSTQEEIAEQYLPLHFDVMMGGGTKYFSHEKRNDKKDLYREFTNQGYTIARNKTEMMMAGHDKPLLGVFAEEALPYTLDQKTNPEELSQVPTLAEMSQKALECLSKNPNGFVVQIEGGKVDWAAHGNDIGALLYDQLAFDDAIAVAINFAKTNNDTLVIITTDHGNSNPGLIKSSIADSGFDLIKSFKHSNDWVLNGINKHDTAKKVIDRIYEAQGITIKEKEARDILMHYSALNEEGVYNAYKLPFKELAKIQQSYTSVGWSGMDHSSDHVELAMFGPGSETLPPFVKNTDLHNFMLNVAGLKPTPD